MFNNDQEELVLTKQGMDQSLLQIIKNHWASTVQQAENLMEWKMDLQLGAEHFSSDPKDVVLSRNQRLCEVQVCMILTLGFLLRVFTSKLEKKVQEIQYIFLK